MRGIFVAVVGSSGAGKDSVMSYAKDRLAPDVTVVRRTVTREADGGSEDHDSMTLDQFVAAETEGRFALSWAAHGLRYGLPIDLEDEMHAGRVVIANLSRAVLPRLRQRYPDAVVVEIAAEPQVIAARLSGRGREDALDIQRRLERNVGMQLPEGTVRIDNSGALEIAGEKFVRLLKDLLGVRA